MTSGLACCCRDVSSKPFVALERACFRGTIVFFMENARISQVYARPSESIFRAGIVLYSFASGFSCQTGGREKRRTRSNLNLILLRA